MKNFSKIEAWLASAAGKPCSEMAVGENNRLTLGFGEGQPDPIRDMPDRKQFEWTMGSFFSTAWRVSDGEVILCGRMESRDNLKIAGKLNPIAIGSFVGVKVFSKFDVRVNFSSGLYVEFMSAVGFDDTMFYIVGPDGYEATYSCLQGWDLKQRSRPVK